MKHYDSLVIGAGPAGSVSALYLARFGLTVALVEKISPGGLLLQTSDIENYPGFPNGILGYELADAFTTQISAYENITNIADPVTEVDLTALPKRVKIGSEWVLADTVVICAGVSYRKLGLPNEGRLYGKGLSHCALCDGNFCKNMPVAVVGGGNSALEEALYLAKLTSKVHIIHRRNEFRASPAYIERLRKMPNVEFHLKSVVTELHGTDFLEGITLKNTDGHEESLAIDGLFVFIGFEPKIDFLPAEHSLALDSQGFIVTDHEMRTNIPGVFAAGDIRAKLCRQIVTATGDGATAANAAFTYLEQQHG